MNTIRLKHGEIAAYLEEMAGCEVQILKMGELGGETRGTAALKQFGYGRSLLVVYRAGWREAKVVFHPESPDVRVNTAALSARESAHLVVNRLEEQELIPGSDRR